MGAQVAHKSKAKGVNKIQLEAKNNKTIHVMYLHASSIYIINVCHI